jgi:hypothetical protein
VVGDCRARRAPHRASTGRTKKRRSGGADGERAAVNTVAEYDALVPEDAWCYVVTKIARAFGGQDWWSVYRCEPHGRPELTWYTFYHLDDAERIDALRRELDELDRAVLVAYAVNKPDELDKRRSALRARLRNDPVRTPALPKWTKQEMNDAVARLMAKNWKTANTIPS